MTPGFARTALTVGTAGLLTVALAGCVGDDADTDTVKIGWELPLSGPFESLGVDLNNGFQLYLKTHGNKLGGREIELVTADETDKPAESLKEAERLVGKEEVVAMAGILNSGAFEAIAPFAQEEGIPVVSPGGRPELDPHKLEGLWHTSSINRQGGEAVAPYMKDEIKGPVYVIGPDYAGGHAKLIGFTETFANEGGKLANKDGEVTWTPFPDTTDFQPYLNEIANSGAKAIFTFYAGAPAIDFVKQYAESDAAGIPLYGLNLTEGSLLEEQGDAAEGVFCPMNYSADLDNAANREFVSEWTAADYPGQPSIYATSAWDTAQVLDMAIDSIPAGEEVTSEAISEAISNLGEITESPRGPWEFDDMTHAPIQTWYLRQVRTDGGELANVVIKELATL